jgi:uncharacterized protein (DUF305 family)
MKVTGRLAAGGFAIAAITGCASTTSGSARAAITPAADAAGPRHTAADVAFMTGMIGHHAQAILMAGWAPSHGASQSVQALCERILVGQRDEIVLMRRWLREWQQPVPEADASHHMMPGMEHTLMPGMLTAEQLAQLDHATGAEFDRLLLTFMIRHHQGALTMVKQLVETPGAARDDNVFKFVSDMNVDQETEINRMKLMLAGIPVGAAGP